MKREHPMYSRGGCWPTPDQELLLQAVLLQGDRAINAWSLWKKNTAIETNMLDPCSFQLLPLLYRNLKHNGVEDPLMEKFKGVYRLTWYKNQRLFHTMSSLLQSFRDAGIRTIILKGAALSFLYYRDPGLCVMADVDILVPTGKVFEAINLLGCVGWTSKFMPLEGFTDGFLKVRHSQPFQDSSGQEVDLHWHLLLECCQADADDDFWAGAIDGTIHNVPTAFLNPTDQLLHICVHGATWNWIPHLRWVTDAMMVLKTSESAVDWARLITQARKRRLTLRLKKALNYLQDKFDAPVPLTVLKDLEDIPVPKSEYLEYKYYIIQPHTFLSALVKFWFANERLTEGAGLWTKLIQLQKFFQYSWGITYRWKVPFHLVFRIIWKLWRTAVWHIKRVDDVLRSDQ